MSIPGISDHEAVYILSNITAKVHMTIPRKIILWNRANFTLIEEIISNFKNEFQLSYDPSTPVSILSDKFKNLCMECLDLIPVKQISSNSTCPWISPMVKCLSRQKQRWYNKAKLSNSPEAWQCYRSLKRECQKQCRLAYHQYINNLADPSSGQWSFIKSKRIDQCTIPLYRWMTLLLLIVILRQKLLTVISGQYSQVKIHLLYRT